MILKVYSKKDPSVLLHIIHKPSDNREAGKIKKQSIADPEHFIQAMFFELPLGSEGKPHKHNAQERITSHTHEALMVFKGSIELSIFDIDHSLVEKQILREGDCYVLINGGHSIKTLTDVKLFEFKNGPYHGPEKDRTYF